MTKANGRTVGFAAFLGLPTPRSHKAAAPAKQPKAKPVPGKRPAANRPQTTASASTPFGHLLAPAAKSPRTPQQRAASRGAAAREIVRAYEQSQPAQPTGPQTAPTMSADAEKALAARIIAAGRKRRGEN